MNVAALELLDHVNEFCSGLRIINDVDIPQLVKTLFSDANGILKFINAMEAAQQKSKRAKLFIQDKYMHAVALKSLLKSSEYKTKTREWSKLPGDPQT